MGIQLGVGIFKSIAAGALGLGLIALSGFVSFLFILFLPSLRCITFYPCLDSIVTLEQGIIQGLIYKL